MTEGTGMPDKDKPHVAIIGSGSAAFAAAIEAVQHGARVTLIESGDVIGGTCVNIGCVPSKILIRGAEVAHQQARHPVAGIQRTASAIDRRAMLEQQQHWVQTLRQAKYERILETYPDIHLRKGMARFEDAETLQVTDAQGNDSRIRADRILIATGASPAVPKITGLADTPFWTSDEALVTDVIPEQLIVVGASAVGLELAQAFLRLGTEVTLLARSTLLAREDPQIGESLAACLQTEGMRVLTNAPVKAVRYRDGRFSVQTEHTALSADKLLLATGRVPNTRALALENAGVITDSKGRIPVDDHLRTNVDHIYAAGDCTDLPQYVYVAAAAGTRAARSMTGADATLDLTVMPRVVFTDPQVASVGLTESEASAQGFECDSRSLAAENIPRAIVNMETQGFIKWVADKRTGKLLGCQVLAREAGEIIQTAALAIRNGMRVQDLAEQLFPYLTMAEGLKLCAQTFSMDVGQLSCCAG